MPIGYVVLGDTSRHCLAVLLSYSQTLTRRIPEHDITYRHAAIIL